MTTTRFLFILFLLLNILFFSASRGWLGLGPSGDAGRISVELYPERIKILGHTPPPGSTSADDNGASSSTPEAPEQPVCLAWSGLNAAQINKLISLFASADIQAAAREVQAAALWRVVRVPSLLTQEAAEILADNMVVDLGVERNSIQIEETVDKKFLIVLGETFRNRRGAERQLEAMSAKGVNASIESRNNTERRVEATVSVKKAEALLEGQPYAKRHKPCLS
ncbi:MAG: hypothetical protein FWD51_02820 [Betaproteobacteria bacterium]|nr:hypothetical protein [Betaproteobacteria bacterium]